jgi:hypothetical protein
MTKKRKCHHPESKISRFKTYEPGDCYAYHIMCSCGFQIAMWTIDEVERKLEEIRKGIKCTNG